jgi:hypothetical protein
MSNNYYVPKSYHLNGVSKCNAVRLRQFYYNGKHLTTCALQYHYFEDRDYLSDIVEFIIRPKNMFKDAMDHLTSSHRKPVYIRAEVSLQYYGDDKLSASIWHIDYDVVDVDEAYIVMDFCCRIDRILGDKYYRVDISSHAFTAYFYFKVTMEDEYLNLAVNDVIQGQGYLRREKLQIGGREKTLLVLDVEKIQAINGVNWCFEKPKLFAKVINTIDSSLKLTGGFDDSFFNFPIQEENEKSGNQ